MLEGISLLYHPRGQLDDCLRLTILERGYRKAEGEGKHRETTAGVITGRWYNIIYCHTFICQELKFIIFIFIITNIPDLAKVMFS